jgi:hypothetical protein
MYSHMLTESRMHLLQGELKQRPECTRTPFIPYTCPARFSLTFPIWFFYINYNLKIQLKNDFQNMCSFLANFSSFKYFYFYFYLLVGSNVLKFLFCRTSALSTLCRRMKKSSNFLL